MTDERRAFRTRVLESCGAPPRVLDELLAYGDQPPSASAPVQSPVCPLPDEPHIASWLAYEREAQEIGAFETLKRHFVQLRFPIAAGMSDEAAYRRATRTGDFSAADEFAPGLVLNRPEDLEFAVHQTMGGRVPVVVAGDRADFVSLVRAFTERNEPAPLAAAMGACLVKGLNNWSRIAAYRAAWERGPDGAGPSTWAEEFQRLIPRKDQYQDRLILLSRGTYSATPAAAVGFDEREWLARSLVIRREHEFTHYFVYRTFGFMRSHVFDEIVADFVGLLRAFGRYDPALALRFLGLEAYPQWRTDGRLGVYRGEPPLSDEAFAVVRSLAYRSASNLAALAGARVTKTPDIGELGRLTFSLSHLSLEELASPDLASLVAAHWS